MDVPEKEIKKEEERREKREEGKKQGIIKEYLSIHFSFAWDPSLTKHSVRMGLL